ncbi:MAG: threonine-phosphate decarboxylase CobD [Pseudomonadota bacterium]
MGDHTTLRHGGGLDDAIRRYGGRRADWLDLSTGISPFSYPFAPPAAATYERLPEQHQLDALLAAARAAYQVPDDGGMVAAPGTQALIQMLPTLMPLGKVVVDPLGYQEHGRCWRLAGHEVVEADDPLSAALDNLDVRYATIIHPHNPSGAWADAKLVFEAAEALFARGGLLIIDEAFCDGAPDRSFVPSLPAGAIVLRSFGKFYGLAGIRVGFAVGAPQLTERLAVQFGPWAVPGPALCIARGALADSAWRSAISARLLRSAQLLAAALEEAGFELVGMTDLFVTVRHPNAVAIEQHLAERHILVRGFDQATALLRFGLPIDDHERQRLVQALIAL